MVSDLARNKHFRSSGMDPAVDFMRHTTRHESLPPAAMTWLLFFASGLSLGLLRNSVTLTLQGNDKASAAVTAFVILGPLTVLAYYFSRWSGDRSMWDWRSRAHFELHYLLQQPLRRTVYANSFLWVFLSLDLR